jgi:hypothetical protein
LGRIERDFGSPLGLVEEDVENEFDDWRALVGSLVAAAVDPVWSVLCFGAGDIFADLVKAG